MGGRVGDGGGGGLWKGRWQEGRGVEGGVGRAALAQQVSPEQRLDG